MCQYFDRTSTCCQLKNVVPGVCYHWGSGSSRHSHQHIYMKVSRNLVVSIIIRGPIQTLHWEYLHTRLTSQTIAFSWGFPNFGTASLTVSKVVLLCHLSELPSESTCSPPNFELCEFRRFIFVFIFPPIHTSPHIFHPSQFLNHERFSSLAFVFFVFCLKAC